MALSVFPERMNRLNPEDTVGSFQTLEAYINYMVERTEFSLSNAFKTTNGIGTSTTEIVLLLAALSNKVNEVDGTVSQIQSTVSGMQTTVGQHTLALVGIQDDVENLQTGKQDLLTFDATPTDDSTNPVTSDGIYTVDEGFDTRITDLDGRMDAVEAVLTSAGPILYTQPQDQTVALGDSAVFSVQVLGAYTYKWEHYYSSTWVEVGWTGHDTSEVTTPATTALMDGRKIRCTITGGGWTIVSQVATLHVE